MSPGPDTPYRTSVEILRAAKSSAKSWFLPSPSPSGSCLDTTPWDGTVLAIARGSMLIRTENDLNRIGGPK